ncbi:MAG: hypothetical protein MRJ67_16645 [Nitrospirales bacterium]|nr:hypothetical protein [Nitrospira sp.]MDR4462121.1 hypothetical protein [Nitrospirales bacterium]MDR4482255.1 hypothetical protein [Nitrospirales bacterium]
METGVAGLVWGAIGFVATAAVGYISPYIISGLQQSVRPVVKGIVKGGLIIDATFSELVSEAQAELTHSSSSS